MAVSYTHLSEDGAVFFSIVFRTYLYLCICLGSLLIVFNKTICRLLLQADFYIAFKYVPFLLLAAIFGCISIYFGTFYQAMKDKDVYKRQRQRNRVKVVAL